MTSHARASLLVAYAAALACAVAAAPIPRSTRDAGDGRVLVYYPAGACNGELELEVYDRAAGAWRPHPEHPRLPPDACAREAPEMLLNELRVRCADPAGLRAPSEWVTGAEVAAASVPCAADRPR